MATKMTLGAYTFWRNPSQFTIPKDQKYYAIQPTYGGVAYFSWGMFTAGQVIRLEWDWMDADAFNSLQDLLDDDVEKTWNPQISGEGTYTVEVLKLEGKYVESAIMDAPWRRNVNLDLLIKS